MKQLLSTLALVVLVLFMGTNTANAQSPEVTGEEGMELHSGCVFFTQPQTVTDWTDTDTVVSPKLTTSQPTPKSVVRPKSVSRLVISEVPRTDTIRENNDQVSHDPAPSTFTFKGVLVKEEGPDAAGDWIRSYLIDASAIKVQSVDTLQGNDGYSERVVVSTMENPDSTNLVIEVRNFTERPVVSLRFIFTPDLATIPAVISVEARPEKSVSNHSSAETLSQVLENHDTTVQLPTRQLSTRPREQRIQTSEIPPPWPSPSDVLRIAQRMLNTLDTDAIIPPLLPVPLYTAEDIELIAIIGVLAIIVVAFGTMTVREIVRQRKKGLYGDPWQPTEFNRCIGRIYDPRAVVTIAEKSLDHATIHATTQNTAATATWSTTEDQSLPGPTPKWISDESSIKGGNSLAGGNSLTNWEHGAH